MMVTGRESTQNKANFQVACRAKQSQFGGGQMDDKCCSEEGLGEESADYAPVKNKASFHFQRRDCLPRPRSGRGQALRGGDMVKLILFSRSQEDRRY
jgi:hypothetical protein